MNRRRSYSFGVLLVLIVSIQVFGSPLVLPVTAANDQGFEWSVEIGSIFNYTLKSNIYAQSSIPPGDYHIYFNLTSLPILEDNITSIDDFRINFLYHYDMYFQNGTRQPFGYYPFMILPTGNWTMMQLIWNDFMHESGTITWINTTTDWGFILESANGDLTSKGMQVFSKMNGLILLYFTTKYRSSVQEDYIEFRYESYSSYPDLIEPSTTSSTSSTTDISNNPTTFNQLESSLILLLSISGGLVIVLMIIVLKKTPHEYS